MGVAGSEEKFGLGRGGVDELLEAGQGGLLRDRGRSNSGAGGSEEPFGAVVVVQAGGVGTDDMGGHDHGDGWAVEQAGFLSLAVAARAFAPTLPLFRSAVRFADDRPLSGGPMGARPLRGLSRASRSRGRGGA
jgi:hypothetical protein